LPQNKAQHGGEDATRHQGAQRAAVRGGWLEAGSGVITEEGRKVLAAREGRRQEAV